ncbi:hypothetical protein KIPB_016832, partial [Kipferlia bialata]
YKGTSVLSDLATSAEKGFGFGLDCLPYILCMTDQEQAVMAPHLFSSYKRGVGMVDAGSAEHPRMMDAVQHDLMEDIVADMHAVIADSSAPLLRDVIGHMAKPNDDPKYAKDAFRLIAAVLPGVVKDSLHPDGTWDPYRPNAVLDQFLRHGLTEALL